MNVLIVFDFYLLLCYKIVTEELYFTQKSIKVSRSATTTKSICAYNGFLPHKCQVNGILNVWCFKMVPNKLVAWVVIDKIIFPSI